MRGYNVVVDWKAEAETPPPDTHPPHIHLKAFLHMKEITWKDFILKCYRRISITFASVIAGYYCKISEI